MRKGVVQSAMCSPRRVDGRACVGHVLVAVIGLVAFPAIAWAELCTYCDANGNNLIDQSDALVFVTCKANSGPSIMAGCEHFDLDSDGDIDQSDFGIFQNCLGASVAPGDPVITEFMASNNTILRDEDGDFSDWIEIYNPYPGEISLTNWYLTDSASHLTKWQFPPAVIPGGGYVIVFASDKNRVVPGRPLHTNFKLDADGEYLALVRPDGATVVSQFAPEFPPQTEDVSYGLDVISSETALVSAGASCRFMVPTTGPLPTLWNSISFHDSSWSMGTTAVGYERGSGYETLIGADVGAAAYGTQTTVLVRIPFMVANPDAYNGLTLKMRYDDGFVAYLNGHELGRANAPDTLAWNSAATADHPDDQALTPVVFNVTDQIGWLMPGLNVLAIQGLNRDVSSSDFLILPELSGTRNDIVQPFTERSFSEPTPGWANGLPGASASPIIADAQCSPAVPTDSQDITVTVSVTAASAPIVSVTLYYRVMFGSETAITMLDDGAHGDGAAGDGVYGAVIPASASTPGQMVRWYLSATDAKGHSGRLPKYDSPLNSAQYFGTVVTDPSVTSQLPVLQWFVENPGAAQTDSGTRASVFFLGRFYDNIKVHLRGDSSSGWPKKNYKFNFNSGEDFTYASGEAPVNEFNLNSTYSDKSYIRQVLAMETYRDAGAPYCYAFPMRVQQNGQFYSVAIFVEEPEANYLARLGLDRDGALYKMSNSLTSTSGAEKKTREDEDKSDLQALINGLWLSGTARTNFVFDNVDVPSCINYWAATTLMHDNDHVGKNYYVYRDTEGSGEWQMTPWDKDLTFGRNCTPSGGVINDEIWADYDPYSHPLFGDSDHPKFDGPWLLLIDALSDTPAIRDMYVRRLRTLMDAQLQPPGTPADQLKYEARINQLIAQMQSDVTLDRNKWGNMYGQNQDLLTATGIIKTQYLAVRRPHLYNTHGPSGDGLIPSAQSAHPTIQFGTVEHSPASGVQDEEYVELKNTHSYAVDVTGWQFQVYDDTISTWETKHTLRPGTVLRADSSLYLTPKTVAFRARATSPKGGEGRFIQGNYHHHIAPGEMLRLLDASGTVIATITAGA